MKKFAIYLFIATALAAAPSFAQDATDYSVDVHTPIQGMIDLVFLVVGGLATWLITYLTARFKLSESSTKLLSKAAGDALGWAHVKAMKAGEDIKDPTVKKKIVADALNYVVKTIPGELVKFGLTEEKIVAFLISKLPAVQGGVQAGISVATQTAALPASEAKAEPVVVPTTPVSAPSV